MTVAVENVDSVVFTCNTNETNITVLWYEGGQLLHGGGRLELSSNNRTLTIRLVRRGDQGIYFCRVWNEFGYQTSEIIQLTVLYGPGSVVTSSYPKANKGTIVSDLNYSVVLQCLATANPRPLISWSLNGNVCGSRDKYIIQRLAQKDLGNYTCTAQNSVGLMISSPIQVQLPQPLSEDTDTGPIEPDPVYSLSGGPAICLTIAGIVGIITFIGGIVYSERKKEELWVSLSLEALQPRR
ncbi:immunoglobulin superfamily member 23 [Dromiciops gliroides]|uniref:immunoglobulin superfamily member 23 n=1 Tax=Dromiciops gliroides TaxID=33562 RepID=UPI001CC41564|nr:immunoglobulin superfamily member 23 [Dromiciops gliroides]